MAYKPSKSPILKYYKKFGGTRFGRWLVSKGICFAAPYFLTIKPIIEVLEPGHMEIRLKKRWRIQNHIKTVHAIAMCNAAEFVGGICLEVSLHGDMRWLPVGMEVEYIKMAKTDLRVVCKLERYDWEEAQDVIMPIEIFDKAGEKVFHANIRMKISPKKKK